MELIDRFEKAQGGAATVLGTVTVLFDQPIANDPTALRAFFEAVGVLDDTVDFEDTPTPVLIIGGRHVQVFAGNEPLASDQLDVRHLHGEVDLGQGFVSLSTGLATIDAVTPHIVGAGPNPWTDGGDMHRLCAVVEKLARHGTHVVLHRAGHVVYTADEWLRRLGDLSDPTCHPFTAWIDVGFSADKTRLSTYGLDVARRPDVHVAVADHEDDEEYALAHDALMLGAYLSAHENRIFEAGDVLVVPPGLGVGPHAIDGGRAALVEDSTCARYVAHDAEDGVVFGREAEGDAIEDVWSRYVAGVEPTLGFLPYRKLLDAQIGSVWRRIASLGRYDVPEPIPPFEVMVFDRGDDFALLTCGLGRQRQVNGTVDGDSAHVELLLPIPQHGPAIAAALAHLAMFLHARGPDAPPWCPNDILHFEEDPVGPAQHYVLAYAGSVPLAEDATVTLLVPSCLTDDEVASLRETDDRPNWVARHGARPEVVARWLIH